MGLGELLDRIREQYTAHLAGAAEQLARKPGVRVLSEVVLCDQNGEPVAAGDLRLPVRLDLVALQEGAEPTSRSVDSEKLITFEPFSFTWADGPWVTLGPFQWDSLAVRMPGALRVADWGPLVGWFREWFREDEDGAGELLGVIHFLSDPEVVGDSKRFTADLGSAPVEAFEGLMDAVVALGVEAVVIGGET